MRIPTVFAIIAAVSPAATMTYTSLATWQAAGPQSAGMVTFSGINQGQYPSLALSGFTFSGNGGNLIVYSPEVSFTNLGAGPSLLGPEGPAGIDIQLPTGVYGMGFLVGTSNGTPVTVVVNGNVATPLTINAPAIPPGSAFWGLRSDIEIVTVRLLTANNIRVVMDSVVWGGQGSNPPPGDAPEPGSVAMLLLAACGAALWRKRSYDIVAKCSRVFSP